LPGSHRGDNEIHLPRRLRRAVGSTNAGVSLQADTRLTFLINKLLVEGDQLQRRSRQCRRKGLAHFAKAEQTEGSCFVHDKLFSAATKILPCINLRAVRSRAERRTNTAPFSISHSISTVKNPEGCSTSRVCGPAGMFLPMTRCATEPGIMQAVATLTAP